MGFNLNIQKSILLFLYLNIKCKGCDFNEVKKTNFCFACPNYY